MASVAANVTVSAALYHPFAFGWRDGVAVAWGAVASYFSANDAPPLFPALSSGGEIAAMPSAEQRVAEPVERADALAA